MTVAGKMPATRGIAEIRRLTSHGSPNVPHWSLRFAPPVRSAIARAQQKPVQTAACTTEQVITDTVVHHGDARF